MTRRPPDDAARAPRGFRLLASHAITSRASDDEAIGACFSYTNRLVRDTLTKAGLGVDDLAWIVPRNMRPAIWDVLARLVGMDRRRVHLGMLPDVPHVAAGDRVLLVTAGPGRWEALLLEKC